MRLYRTLLPRLARPLQKRLQRLTKSKRLQLNGCSATHRRCRTLLRRDRTSKGHRRALGTDLNLIRLLVRRNHCRTTVPSLTALLPRTRTLESTTLAVRVLRRLTRTCNCAKRLDHDITLLRQTLRLIRARKLDSLRIPALRILIGICR